MKAITLAIALIICLLSHFSALASGVDSLGRIAIPEVTIQDQNIRDYAELAQLNRIQSQPTGESASVLLKQCQSCFVKNYGPGSLASFSIRGFSASQTQIYWDNIPIFNPMLGQSDLFLLSPLAGQNLRILSNSRAEGAAGEIMIESQAIDYSGLQFGLYQQLGSWMQSRTGAWLKAGIGSRLSLITAVQRESSQNDFLYKNPHWPGLDSRRNEHGAYQLWSMRQGIGIAISDVWFMEFDYWAAFGDRELSPNMTEWSSRRYQLDNQHRLKWATNARWKQNEFSLYSGFVSHENLYRDSASAIYSDNLSRTLSSGAVLKGRKGNVLYAAMLRHDMQSGSSSTYSALQQALHASGELGYRYKAGRLKIDFLAKFKQSIIDNQWGPPSPELGFDMAFIGSQSFGLRFFVKRQFRFPTLNERFWEPGGNPNLLPEEGWGQFADLSYQFRKGLSQSGVKLSAYHQQVDNYILWAPNSIGLWEASNLESVNAIGLEASLDQELDVGFLNVSLSATYGFHKLGSKNEAGEWEQAIYAPQHQGLLAADIGYKNLKIGTDLQFTGLRFTTTDNSESLPGFNTWNAYLSYSFPFRDSHTLVAGLYLDNLLSADYQTVANRPMPGRSIRFSLKYEFVKGGQR